MDDDLNGLQRYMRYKYARIPYNATYTLEPYIRYIYARIPYTHFA
jgi:hypothetical protein